jgi:hypothetical protein
MKVQVLDQTADDVPPPHFVRSLRGGMISKLFQVIHFASGISSKAVVHFYIAGMQTFRSGKGLFLYDLLLATKKDYHVA